MERTEQQIKGILPFVCEFWDFKVSWICILNEQRGDPEPKKQEKGLEKVSTNRPNTKQNIVFRVCRHLELFVSSCSWEVPCVVKHWKGRMCSNPGTFAGEKVFVWFVCLQYLLTLKSGEKLYYSCKSSVLHTREKATSPPRFCCSRTGEKPILSTAETPLGNWGKLIKMRHGLCTEWAVSWGDVQGDLTQRFGQGFREVCDETIITSRRLKTLHKQSPGAQHSFTVNTELEFWFIFCCFYT